MARLHQRQGRFVTVLPRTRSEDAAFQALVTAGQVAWRSLGQKTDESGARKRRLTKSAMNVSLVQQDLRSWRVL